MTARRNSPTIRRRRLGAELRRHREAAGLTIERVATRLRCSASKISRIETGQTGASPRDVKDMLSLYNVSEAELEDLMEVAHQTRQRGWWQPYGSVLVGAYIGFEAAAHSIRAYEAQCVPGLLQTDDYARTIISASSITDKELNNRVRVRMARQTLLSQDEPIDLWVILDEAALLRPVGGPEVMRTQLDHLATEAERPNVTLQVLPLEVGAHAGMDGSFVILRFPDEADPDTAFVVMATGGVFQEKPDELGRYEMIFESLRNLALPTDESIALVAKLAKESK